MLLYVRGPSQLWAPIPTYGDLSCVSIERRLNTCKHRWSISLCSCLRMCVSYLFKFPCLDFHAIMNCNLELQAETKPFPQSFFLLGYFITVTWNKIRTCHLHAVVSTISFMDSESEGHATTYWNKSNKTWCSMGRGIQYVMKWKFLKRYVPGGCFHMLSLLFILWIQVWK